MKVLVSGVHGLLGSALVPALAARGHAVVPLVRASGPWPPDVAAWDPQAGRVNAPALEGVDAVVHLAGENLAAGRWTAERKKRIRDSRVVGTRVLADALAGLHRRPWTLICASATGYYGHRGEEILIEASVPGTGFLAALCRDWEAAAAPAQDAGVRVVHLRSGIVLSPTGGALARLLPLFRLGLGGTLGTGRQFMPWITLEDEIGAILHLLTHDVQGPVNAVSPHPVTNREFTTTLSRILHRPALLLVPGWALWIALGDVAGELLASERVHPARLLETGYTFRHPELEIALRDLLGAGAATRRGA